MTKKTAALELTLAGVLWGFGFIATVWALTSFTPVEVLFLRFLVATVSGEIIFFLLHGAKFRNLQRDFFAALPAGLFLGGMLLLQTIGLKFTTATKSGFITSLYAILVPAINSLFFKKRVSLQSYFLVVLALVGTYLLVDSRLTEINSGDLWTIACSVVAAFHIIYIGHISPKIGNSFRFNNFQSLWCLLALLPLLATQKTFFAQTPSQLAIAGVFCLGLGSSVIAFFLQIRAQKFLTDTSASMLFLLESPFAAVFAFMILGERLSWPQTLGALIILLASLLQILISEEKKTNSLFPQ